MHYLHDEVSDTETERDGCEFDLANLGLGDGGAGDSRWLGGCG